MKTLYQRLDLADYRPFSNREYAIRMVWEFVQSTILRALPRRSFRTRGRILSLFGAKIGRSAKVCKGVRIRHPWLLEIAEYSEIGEGTEIYNLGRISIGAHTVISQRAFLCAGTHDLGLVSRPLLRPPISIGSGVWVCAGAFIGPGVTIGNNAVVGAFAVVVKNVEEAMVVAGNPARVVAPRRRPSDLP
jgi:putative colanic acid biosynthesis acetyltransferase WcaF